MLRAARTARRMFMHPLCKAGIIELADLRVDCKICCFLFFFLDGKITFHNSDVRPPSTRGSISERLHAGARLTLGPPRRFIMAQGLYISPMLLFATCISRQPLSRVSHKPEDLLTNAYALPVTPASNLSLLRGCTREQTDTAIYPPLRISLYCIFPIRRLHP